MASAFFFFFSADFIRMNLNYEYWIDNEAWNELEVIWIAKLD